MNLRDWFRLQPDDEPRKASGRTNEKSLYCVYCDARTRFEVDDDGPVAVCVVNPAHRERV